MESAENGHHYHHPQPFIGSSSSSTTNFSNFCYGVVSNTATPHSWATSNQSHPSINEFHSMDLHFPQRIKHEEFSSFYYPNFTEMLTSNLHSDDCDRGFVHNFYNISSCLNQIGVAEANSFDMTSETLDHLGSSQISANGLIPYCPPNYTPQSNQSQLSSLSDRVCHKVPASCNNEAKRDNQKHKKQRLEAHSCRPLLKVRKEKLGDRIAALQQLVAPFGKTDTASVLMEAIGYIKFLQDQVETLAVLYMKASRPNPTTTPFKQGDDDGEVECELRSRGLCLVPMSWLSCIPKTI